MSFSSPTNDRHFIPELSYEELSTKLIKARKSQVQQITRNMKWVQNYEQVQFVTEPQTSLRY